MFQESVGVKVHSQRAKVEAKANIFFDAFRLLYYFWACSFAPDFAWGEHALIFGLRVYSYQANVGAKAKQIKE